MGAMRRILRRRPRPSERGFVLIVVLGIMTTLVMLVVGFLSLTKTEADMAVHIQDAARAEQAAWGAIEYLIANICTQAFGAHGSLIRNDYYTTRCLQDPNGWWYREYRPLISVDRTEADDWDWQASQWVTFPNIEPWHATSWMYFPDGDPAPLVREQQQLRMEFHVIDENAFINTNDWLYDHAPTAAQQANMLAALIPPTFLERDYMIMNGYCASDLSGGWPTLNSVHDKYQRTRIKPVEAWIQATDTRRKRKLAYLGHPTAEGTLPHLMTNMEYEPSENIYGWGYYDGTINMLRYNSDGHWNTAVYGTERDNSSDANLEHVSASTERLGYQDPDTGLSPLNVNTAARSLEPEFQNGWDGYPWGYVAGAQCMNVTEALVPAESLWQLLIVDPSYRGSAVMVDTTGDGVGDKAMCNPRDGNGAEGGGAPARIVISDELLQWWMNENPEIAGYWRDPDNDGNVPEQAVFPLRYEDVLPLPAGLDNNWEFIEDDPSLNPDPEDRTLYQEARQELVERMAWQLAFQYQEVICRWLMGSYWDMRTGEGQEAHTSSGGRNSGYGYAGNDWYQDYYERYGADLATELNDRYALSNTSGNQHGDDVGVRNRENTTRWPGTRSVFWNEMYEGLRNLSRGTRLAPEYSAAGQSEYLLSHDKIGVGLDANGADNTAGNADDNEVVIEMGEGKLCHWIADAVYNSFRPGMGHSIWGGDPLTTLSNNEDSGSFDSAYQSAWNVNHDWRADTGSDVVGNFASMGCRWPGGPAAPKGFPGYMKFGGYAPHDSGRYKNIYYPVIDGNTVTAYYPARNIYQLLYDGANPPEEEPPGMTPRSTKVGSDGVSRRQYWRKQFTPNSMATEITNASTTFRFVAMGQLVKLNDPDDVQDDRVFYERRLAGYFEIAPDIANEAVGGWTPNKDAGEWYASGAPAYWRANLNFEGWRVYELGDSEVTGIPAGMGWDSNDIPNGNVSRSHGDPRYRLGEGPLGQHDRWYDVRGFHYSNYGGTMQTKRRVQFLHFMDNNLR